jgi:hypothetical protein
MTTKADLIDQILGLRPERDLEQLRALTRELVNLGGRSGAEKQLFEGTMLRGIPGYSSDLLPKWQRVLVTGGTGCVGHVVLTHLVSDLPDAQFVSVSRRPPVAERKSDRVSYRRGDVRSLRKMVELMEEFRPDLVVHLAAQRNPALAEKRVAETVSTNVLGSQVVLEAAGETGVGTVVVASTGKAVRLFTRDTYAATKKLVEYQSEVMSKRYDMDITCARFTHVVDNSLVGQNILKWIANDDPIQLHSPFVQLPVQSALECYQLLMTAGMVAEPNRPKVVALRNLGWPPVVLLDLTLDYLAEHPSSRAPIVFTGYPPGYEAAAYPGTYDPMSAGDVSPLLNCIEATRTTPTPVLGNWVDQLDLTDGQSARLDQALCEVTEACGAKKMDDRLIRSLLHTASIIQLQHSMEQTDPERVRRVHQFGCRHDPLVDDHAFIHQSLEALLHTEHAALV